MTSPLAEKNQKLKKQRMYKFIK